MRGEVKRNNIGEKKTSRWSLKMSESCFLMAGHNKPSVLVFFFVCSPHRTRYLPVGEEKANMCRIHTRKNYVGMTMMWEWTRSEMLVKHEFSAERMFANKKKYTTEQCNNEPRTLERGKREWYCRPRRHRRRQRTAAGQRRRGKRERSKEDNICTDWTRSFSPFHCLLPLLSSSVYTSPCVKSTLRFNYIWWDGWALKSCFVVIRLAIGVIGSSNTGQCTEKEKENDL